MSYDIFKMDAGPPVDIVAVDGVNILLHDLVTHGLGHPRGDVAQVMNNTGLGGRWGYISRLSVEISSYLVVQQLVRHKAAAVRDVKMSIINP